MPYEDFKYLARRTASDKFLRKKAFNIAKNPKYDGYQRGLGSMVYKFFDKKASGGAMLCHQLVENLKHRKVYSLFKDNIWGANLADIKSINKFNNGFRFLSCVLTFLVSMLGLFFQETKKV